MSVYRQLIALTVLGGLVGMAWRGVSRVQSDRRSTRPRAEPEHLQTWEGEGGGVPVDRHRTAAQVRPT
jgi:hypothetical protein